MVIYCPQTRKEYAQWGARLDAVHGHSTQDVIIQYNTRCLYTYRLRGLRADWLTRE